MSDQADPLWLVGLRQLQQLQQSQEVLAVVRTASGAGLFPLLARPESSDGLAVTPARIEAVLGVLGSHHIVTRVG